MSVLSNIWFLLASRTVTIWIGGVFILYYLSVALWSKEAFASFVLNLSRNDLFRVLYVLFFINITARVTVKIKEMTRSKVRLLIRLPLYAGFLLFLVSFFMSLNIRQSRTILLGEGDPVEVPWERTVYQVVKVKPALQEKALRTENSAVFDYEPGLTITGPAGTLYEISAFPPAHIGKGYLHVLNFGIGPGVELKKAGKTVSKGYIALRLTPFGAVDFFQIPPWPYTFYLSVLPNRTVAKGREAGREYDLKRPRYGVEVARGDKIVTREETDTSIRFEGNMSLHFSSPSDWVLVEAVYDPFYLWFVTSLALLAGGCLLYPFSYLAGSDS